MRAAADDSGAHPRLDQEGDAPPIDLDQFAGHLDFLASGRRRLVRNIHVGADAGLIVSFDERLDRRGAGLFHQEDHVRRGEHDGRCQVGRAEVGRDCHGLSIGESDFEG